MTSRIKAGSTGARRGGNVLIACGVTHVTAPMDHRGAADVATPSECLIALSFSLSLPFPPF